MTDSRPAYRLVSASTYMCGTCGCAVPAAGGAPEIHSNWHGRVEDALRYTEEGRAAAGFIAGYPNRCGPECGAEHTRDSDSREMWRIAWPPHREHPHTVVECPHIERHRP